MDKIHNEGFLSSPIHQKYVIATARVRQDIIRLILREFAAGLVLLGYRS
jgi:hypothetical protein